MKDENDILYRPSLKLNASYYADGIVEREDDKEPIKQIPLNPTHTLINEIDNIEKALLFIPGAIRPCIESILNLVRFLLILIGDQYQESDENDNEYEITTPDEHPTIIPGENTNVPPDIELDDIFSNEHKPSVIIKDRTTDEVKIKRNYSRSTYDISEFYIDRLNNILADYHIQLMIQPELKQVLEVIYKDPLLDKENYLAHSIMQGLLKSQKEKEDKMRLYQKLYNEKESLTILKSLEYSKLTLLKNTSHHPKNPRLYYKHIQMIESEKGRLDKKLFEYYRYLNSSLMLLEECLNLNITEAIAKIELNKINEEYKKEHDLL